MLVRNEIAIDVTVSIKSKKCKYNLGSSPCIDINETLLCCDRTLRALWLGGPRQLPSLPILKASTALR